MCIELEGSLIIQQHRVYGFQQKKNIRRQSEIHINTIKESSYTSCCYQQEPGNRHRAKRHMKNVNNLKNTMKKLKVVKNKKAELHEQVGHSRLSHHYQCGLLTSDTDNNVGDSKEYCSENALIVTDPVTRYEY